MKVIAIERKYVLGLSFLPVPLTKEFHYQCEMCDTKVEFGHFLMFIFSWIAVCATVFLVAIEPDNYYYWFLFVSIFLWTTYQTRQRWCYRKN